MPLTPSRVASLAGALAHDRDAALLFKKLATCVIDRGLLPAGPAAVDSLAWRAPTPGSPTCAGGWRYRPC